MQVTREEVMRLALELGVKPILYTDEINGKQTCRDDLWLLDTGQLTALLQAAKNDTVNLAKPLAESAVASHEHWACRKDCAAAIRALKTKGGAQ